MGLLFSAWDIWQAGGRQTTMTDLRRMVPLTAARNSLPPTILVMLPYIARRTDQTIFTTYHCAKLARYENLQFTCWYIHFLLSPADILIRRSTQLLGISRCRQEDLRRELPGLLEPAESIVIEELFDSPDEGGERKREDQILCHCQINHVCNHVLQWFFVSWRIKAFG